MDTQRHDFSINSEEISRAIYCNTRETDNVKNPNQFLPQERTIVSMDGDKFCQCSKGVSEGYNCKGCQAINAVQKPWKAQTHLNIDCRNIEINNTSNESQLYMLPDTGEVPYWAENVSSFSEDSRLENKPIQVTALHMGRKAAGKICITDQINYKPIPQPPIPMPMPMPMQYQQQQHQPQQQQQQLRTEKAIGYWKNRYCDQKYTYQQESRSTKPEAIYAVSEAPTNLMYRETDPSANRMNETTLNHQILNPKNLKMPSNNNKHLSPHYARNCTQQCSLQEQNSGYSNLYMSTPQFSSDKFATIMAEKKSDFLTGSGSVSVSNTTNEIRLLNETSKQCESSLTPGSSPIPIPIPIPTAAVYTHKKGFQSRDKDLIRSYTPQVQAEQIQHQQDLYSRIRATSGQQQVHCLSPLNTHRENSHLPSNVSSNFGNQQQFEQYQFSRSPVTMSSSDFVQSNMEQRIQSFKYSNREDIAHPMDGASGIATIANNRNGLFHNPYNSSPNCCNEPAALATIIPDCRHDSPHEYNKNYNEKSLEDIDSPISNNEINPLNQYPRHSAAAERILPEKFRAQQYCYDNLHPKHINKLSYLSTPCSNPADSMVHASPPSHILQTSQTHQQPQPQPQHQHQPNHKMHHMQYFSQYVQPCKPYSQPDIESKVPNGRSEICESKVISAQTAPYNRNHLSNHPRLSHTNAVSPPSAVVNSIPTPTPTTHSTMSPQVLQAIHTKKSQIPKPNYRELINQVHARRSATTEEELNMQIIKKTLNVDTSKSLSQNMSKISSTTVLPMSNTQQQTKNKSLEGTTISDLTNRQMSYEGQTCISDSLKNLLPPPLSNEHHQHHSYNPINNICNVSTQLIAIEKPSNSASSPLDLSMRTVKTKADSTNCKYQMLPKIYSNNNNNNNNSNSSFTLPRVNFTPNFTLATTNNDTNIKNANASIVVDRSRSKSTEKGSEVNVYMGSSNFIALKPKIEQGHIYPQVISTKEKCFFSPDHHISDTKICHTNTNEPTKVESKHSVPCEKLQTFNSYAHAHAHVLNSSVKQPIDVGQVRPSVLETNPYSSIRVANSDSTSTSTTTTPTETRTYLSINQLPPDTSIMPLVKNSVVADKFSLPCSRGSGSGLGLGLGLGLRKVEETFSKNSIVVVDEHMQHGHARKIIEQFPYEKSPQANATLIQSTSNTEHCNNFQQEFFSRKRSIVGPLPNQSYIKQPKLEEIPLKLNSAQEVKVPVIAINERHIDVERSRTAEKSIQAEIPPYVQQTSNPNENILTFKTEPVSPTSTYQHQTTASLQFATQHKSNTESSSLMAARIRTKAELKGFTFMPPVLKDTDAMPMPPDSIRIKEESESCQTPTITLSCLTELVDDYKQESLLDFSWNKTCNSLVQQLLSNPKKVPSKKDADAKTDKEQNENQEQHEQEQSKNNLNIEFLPFTTAGATTTTATTTKQTTTKHFADHGGTSQDKKSLIAVNDIPQSEPSESRSDIQSSNLDAILTLSQDVCVSSSISPQKKICKIGRDKLRIQQEKRFAARLKDESSSESDNELDRRKSDRLKKPLKKAKARQKTPIAKNHFSDCGSDSSETDSNHFKKENTIKESKAIRKTTKNLRNYITTGTEKPTTHQQLTTTTTIGANHNSNEEESSSSSRVKIKKSQQSEQNQSQQKQKQTVIESVKLTTPPNTNKTVHHKSNNKKTQFENGKLNENEKVNNIKKEKKTSLKIGHDTITRSKRKRELELQLANSKVLRNDKIIRNTTTTTKIKRKYVRKFSNQSNNQCSTNKNKDFHNQLIMSTRLRSRKDGNTDKSSRGGMKIKSIKRKGDTEKDSCSTLKGLNDRNSDILMEVYRYKRSLKIPPSLITIKHPNNNKIQTNLPDLENHNNSVLASNSNSNSNSAKLGEAVKQQNIESDMPTQPRSIIDVLHSRVIKSSTSTLLSSTSTSSSVSMKSPMKPVKNNSQKVVFNENNNKINERFCKNNNNQGSSVQHSSDKDQEQEGNDDNGDAHAQNMSKKRHFSIFDTKVLQSKTRTESKMQQKREIIREIFVGDDRPASAPPEIVPAPENDVKMTYEQKYEQFLQQMNIVVNETSLCKFRKKMPTLPLESLGQRDTYKNCTIVTDDVIKAEDGTESVDVTQNPPPHKGDGVEGLKDGVGSTLTAFATGPHLNNIRRRKCGKYFRRKGSSGFDYIRKKKKPASICNSGAQQIFTAAKTETKYEAEFEAKEKTEEDVCREIQKWVLNKGVGQSTMHKAARLGYIDVIVYCLDRLCMNPDQKDNAGYTPLHEACTNGWLEIAKVLLQYGAKHSETAHSGIRPLHEASENDHAEIVRLLLSYGADPLLATYSGQTPLMLASSNCVRDILKNHLLDVQYVGPDRKPWRFEGPWRIFDVTEDGYNIFSGAPNNNNCDTSRALNRNFGSNGTMNRKERVQYDGKAVIHTYTKVFDNRKRLSSISLYDDCEPRRFVDNKTDSEDELFEFEEADVLLPPLYLLKDEGAEKWVLLSDLCNLLKVKSKDTLLNKICPSSSLSTIHKDLVRELKMSDFLEKATCLQLLCAGEKINICASKVVLIKYNESVRNLLGVNKILMKF